MKLCLANLAASFLLVALDSGVAAAAERPNIVMILADDQGTHQVGCYGNDFYDTPHIDRLAREGMRFTSAYAACPVCSPTRASIMTGKYPARLHVTDFIAGESHNLKLRIPDWTKYLPLEETTIAEALKQSGYATGHFGKWHLNVDKNYKPGRSGDPGSQGFDEVYTTVKPKPSADPEADPHHVRRITDRAVEFIESNRSGPFFCYVTHNAIHNPLLAPKSLVAKYAARAAADKGKNLPVIAALNETLDTSVGRILDALDRLDLADDTLVVYFSDNGALPGRDQHKPLWGGKAQLYEGGIRVPMIVRWPGRVAAESTCDTPVSSIDFFPTFLAAAGRPTDDPSIDGVDLTPLLAQSSDLDREALFWHYPHYHRTGKLQPGGAIRLGQYKLIEWYEQSIDGLDTPGALSLFDLRQDPGERHDLVDNMPQLARKLAGRLAAWRTSVGAQEMTRNPNYRRGKRSVP